jgi:Hexokinase
MLRYATHCTPCCAPPAYCCCVSLCADLCEVESDMTPARSKVARVLQQTLGLYPDFVPIETRYMVQAIVRLVVRRSARTAASLLVAVLRLQGWLEAPRRLVVAVDGGVFLKYVNWRHFLDAYLRESFGADQSRALPPRCLLATLYLHCSRSGKQQSPPVLTACPHRQAPVPTS